MACPSLSAGLLWFLGALLVAVLTANRDRLRLRAVWGLVGIDAGVGLLLSSTEPGVARQPQVSVRRSGLLFSIRTCGQALFYLFHLRSCAASAVGSNVASNRFNRSVEEWVWAGLWRGLEGWFRVLSIIRIVCVFGIHWGLQLRGRGLIWAAVWALPPRSWLQGFGEPSSSWDGIAFALVPMPYAVLSQSVLDDLRNDSILDSNRSSYLYILVSRFLY